MLEQLQNIGDTISHTGELIVAKVFEPYIKEENEGYELNSDWNCSVAKEARKILCCPLLVWSNGQLMLLEVQKYEQSHKNVVNPQDFKECAEMPFVLNFPFLHALDTHDARIVMENWLFDRMDIETPCANINFEAKMLVGKHVIFDSWHSVLHRHTGTIMLDCYHRAGKEPIPRVICRDTHMRLLKTTTNAEVDSALDDFASSAGANAGAGLCSKKLRKQELERHLRILKERSAAQNELKLRIEAQRLRHQEFWQNMKKQQQAQSETTETPSGKQLEPGNATDTGLLDSAPNTQSQAVVAF